VPDHQQRISGNWHDREARWRRSGIASVAAVPTHRVVLQSIQPGRNADRVLRRLEEAMGESPLIDGTVLHYVVGASNVEAARDYVRTRLDDYAPGSSNVVRIER
jgi:hypothetical protein